jgi:hypothetical protein
MERLHYTTWKVILSIDTKQGFQVFEILGLTMRMLGFSPFLSANLLSRVIQVLMSTRFLREAQTEGVSSQHVEPFLHQ